MKLDSAVARWAILLCTSICLLVAPPALKGDTVYSVSLPSLTGNYPAGQQVSSVDSQWSIPVQNGVVHIESMALHYTVQVNDFPVGQNPSGDVVPIGVESAGSLLFENLQAPGNSYGMTWAMPVEPSGFSYDSQANEFELIQTRLPNNVFDIWIIANLQQAYGFNPISNGVGTAELSFYWETGIPEISPGDVTVLSATALLSPDTVITPLSPVTQVPEPSSAILLVLGGLATYKLRHSVKA